ncbi:hypothetical protein [Crucivirus-538]|nr:hypothetical protein [Crucivirus-538]
MPALYRKKRKRRYRHKRRRYSDNHAQVVGARGIQSVDQNKPEHVADHPPSGWKPPVMPPPVTEFIPGKDPKKIMPLLGLSKPVTVKDFIHAKYEEYLKKAPNAKAWGYDEQHFADDQYWELSGQKDAYIKDIPWYIYAQDSAKQEMADEYGKWKHEKNPVPNLPLEEWSENIPTRQPSTGFKFPLTPLHKDKPWVPDPATKMPWEMPSYTTPGWIQPKHKDSWSVDQHRHTPALGGDDAAETVAGLIAAYLGGLGIKKIGKFGISKLANWVSKQVPKGTPLHNAFHRLHQATNEGHITVGRGAYESKKGSVAEMLREEGRKSPFQQTQKFHNKPQEFPRIDPKGKMELKLDNARIVDNFEGLLQDTPLPKNLSPAQYNILRPDTPIEEFFGLGKRPRRKQPTRDFTKHAKQIFRETQFLIDNN